MGRMKEAPAAMPGPFFGLMSDQRHCERQSRAAIQSSYKAAPDCFVASFLAMTIFPITLLV